MKQLNSFPLAMLCITVIFTLTLPKALAQHHYKTLHTIKGGTDGSLPHSELIRDLAGNLYGTRGRAVRTMSAPSSD